MVNGGVAKLESRALPWMQVAGSSVLMSPLHTGDIVAALSQISSLSGWQLLDNRS